MRNCYFNHSSIENEKANLSELGDVCRRFCILCFIIFVLAFFGQATLSLHSLIKRLLELCFPQAVFPSPAPRSLSSDVPEHQVHHLGVIMDGNRRYGRSHGMLTHQQQSKNIKEVYERICEGEGSISKGCLELNSQWMQKQYEYFVSLIRFTALDGHRKGGEKLIEFIGFCIEAKVSMLTVYAFSTDNWNRPSCEIDALMTLFFFFFDQIRSTAHEKGIFIRFISTEPDRLPPRVYDLMTVIENETRGIQPRRITVNVCVSYSGQSEVAQACNRALQRRLCAYSPDKGVPITTEELCSEMLRSITQWSHEEEDYSIFGSSIRREPELILRTSGEQRISNFLLYECAYSEFVFFSKTWPELTRSDLFHALLDFAKRDRRKGK